MYKVVLKSNVKSKFRSMKYSLDRNNKYAINKVTRFILRKANNLVPVDTGTLKRSGKIIAVGLITWDTVYARRQYYGHKYKKRWAERAVSKYISDFGEQYAKVVFK